MIDDNRKIGIGLCLLGLMCFFFGVILFFDRALLALGNMAFLVGLSFLLGIQKTSRFFLRKEKAIGSVCFFAGFALVIYGYAFVGFLLEAYGFWKLFAAFLPNVMHSLKLIPGVGFILSVPPFKWVADYAYDQRRLPLQPLNQVCSINLSGYRKLLVGSAVMAKAKPKAITKTEQLREMVDANPKGYRLEFGMPLNALPSAFGPPRSPVKSVTGDRIVMKWSCSDDDIGEGGCQNILVKMYGVDRSACEGFFYIKCRLQHERAPIRDIYFEGQWRHPVTEGEVDRERVQLDYHLKYVQMEDGRFNLNVLSLNSVLRVGAGGRTCGGRLMASTGKEVWHFCTLCREPDEVIDDGVLRVNEDNEDSEDTDVDEVIVSDLPKDRRGAPTVDDFIRKHTKGMREELWKESQQFISNETERRARLREEARRHDRPPKVVSVIGLLGS
ncbi:golgi transport 1B [Perkinsus chesapeaki]|uniref:Golgi transport 1B n=1 Tax=Perkinsus chesapeaki TaxID=330153 RepID=A0A7J6M529_PERCH|nr:golgi transport 1B [Perkinsus chesapeaki]